MASISSYRERLYVLGRFPNKDGSDGVKQSRIATGLSDTPANRKVVEKQVKKINAQLKNGTFDWAEWETRRTAHGTTWRQAISKLHHQKCVLGTVKDSTWNENYMGSLKLLPPGELVTTESIEKALSKWERGTYTYKKVTGLLKSIAVLCDVKFPEVPVPTYTKKAVALKDVPTDQEIVDWVLSAEQPYRWFWGMAATYGLRPHEIEVAEMIQKDYLQVPEETKTGFRTVIPVRREWVDLFGLRDKQERAIDHRNDERSDAVSQMLTKARLRMKIKWTTYTLRHAYAGRLWLEGGSKLDVFTAAKLMGHSMKEHVETYRAFIDPNQVAAVAEAALDANKLAALTQMQEALSDPAQEPQH